MTNKTIVHVIGTGTIGEPLIGLFTDFKKAWGIDEVTFHKRTPAPNDRAMVERRGDEVDGAPVDPHSVSQCAAMRIEPWVRRQQRRMDIEHLPFVTPDELRSQDAHEAREHDEVGLGCVDGLAQCLVERFTLGVGGVRNDDAGDAVRACDVERRDIGPVADDRGNRPPERAVALGREQRAEVRAAS